MADLSAVQNLKVAYNILENRDKGDYDVYTMDLKGTGNQNVTRHPVLAWTYQVWKDKLFFLSDRDTCSRCFFLYESDAEGRNTRKISNLQLEDSWMDSRNNGKELIVTGRIGKNMPYQFFLVNVESGTSRQITRDPTSYHCNPT